MQYLVVVRPFGSYRIGDIVTDAQSIQKIISCEHADHVVRISAPSED